jgi:hypothetical protein
MRTRGTRLGGRARAVVAAAATTVALLSAAPAAHAGLSTWTPLPGLNAAAGANWVRTYATGPLPTTIYAGTEGDGVYRSLTDGLAWAPFSTGLDAPGARDVRVVYSGGGAIWAGTGAGLYRSVGGGPWSPVAQGPEDDPAQPRKLNASVQAVLSTIGGPLLAGTAFHGVSRSSDGGMTWTPPSPSNGMPQGETVWSLTGIGPLVFAATTSGVYRSTDWGATWSLASDGIPGIATVLRVIGDGTNPNILYAATGSDGVYRSLDLGISWAPISGGLGNTTVRAIQQFSGPSVTRLYAATGDGLWSGSTGNGPLPGPVTWRKVTQNGLGGASIFWALTTFTTTPGTLLAGSQSDGGFALTFEPPSNAALPSAIGTAQVGQTLVGLTGSWNGTPTISLERQWQLCTTSSPGTCRDVDGAQDLGFTLAQRDQGKWVRLKVSAENDFPTPGPTKPAAYSAVVGPVAANPADLPGATQQLAPSIRVLVPGDPSLPKVGDTLQAYGWMFNPAPSAGRTTFQWLRCDENGDHCAEIAGETGQQHVLVTADAEVRLRVRVGGTNGAGTAYLQDSGPTNTIIPDPATALTPPTLAGVAVVGSTLVGGVGSWKSAKTTWERRWELCEADGSGCDPVFGETRAGYVVRAGDLGKRLRMRVLADVNESYKLPAAVEAYTPLSAVVTLPPGSDPGPGTGGGPGPAGPGPGPGPVADVTRPKLSGAGVTVTRAGVKVSARLSEAGVLTAVVQRQVAGHRKGKRCLAGRKRGAKACTTWKTVGTFKRAVRTGRVSVTIPRRLGGRRLARGGYRAQITVRDGAGNLSAAQTVRFRLR